MSKTYPHALLGLLALVGLALAQTAPMVPLKVKAGLWENHSTITTSGVLGIPPEVAGKMTPEQRAQMAAAMGAAGTAHTTDNTDKGCVTQQDLTQDPARLLHSDSDMKCQGEVIHSTASDLEMHITCTGTAQMDMHFMVHAQDQEHVTGQGNGSVTMGGHTMHSTYKIDNRWLGATCPADGSSGQR
ncbi:MAG TPA: DUF3617 domain-containing protein [Terriglobales bacterium]|nr:DUF3617 domain-containing protein [Terriglobales bacterium]